MYQLHAPVEFNEEEIENAKVSSLIDNISLVKTMFNPITTTTIFKIVLSLYPHADKCIWTEENDGKFSVRSVYQLIKIFRMQSLGESSNAHS